MRSDVVGHGGLDDIAMRNHGDNTVHMVVADTIQGGDGASLNFGQRLAAREACAAGIALNPGPQRIFAQRLELGALPLAVLHLADTVERLDLEAMRGGYERGRLLGPLQWASIYGVKAMEGQPSGEVRRFGAPGLVEVNARSPTSQPGFHPVVAGVSDEQQLQR
jgi:hypothetical protein